MIRYRIQPESPRAHIFRVELSIPNPDPNGERLTLPAWIPGSYMIRDFSRNILSLSAESDGELVKTEKVDKQTWHCAPCEGELRVSYQVYAWDLSVRSAHLDTTHGYFNGTSVFLRLPAHEHEACEVEIAPPSGERYASWRVATTLEPHGTAPLAFGGYRAKNYRDLVDHPVEMGNFTFVSFDVDGTEHRIAITGKHRTDTDRLVSDLQKICARHISLFGELPEMPCYLFQVMVVGDGYGGLEHGNSTSLICSRSDLPIKGMGEATEGYRKFLGLCSHEYFHLWNVKRISPTAVISSDLASEAYTRLLWLFEGFTSYYDDLNLVRSRCISEESYLEMLAQSITRLMRGSGRKKQSVTESSFDAWTKFYKQDENSPNAIVSYYTKGGIIALVLDLKIRQSTNSASSLDHVMRALWMEFGRCDRTVDEEGIEDFISGVCQLDLGPFFEKALRGCDDLPVAEFLESVGIGMQLRAAKNIKDQGGLVRGQPKGEPARRVIGARYEEAGDALRLLNVFDGGAAQQAGLSAGDVVIAVDGIKATGANLDGLLRQTGGERSIEIHAFRRDELMTLDLLPLPAPEDTCDLFILEDAGETQKCARKEWIDGYFLEPQ
jgi:predicted metalloprotease with PDZ domain